MSSTKVFFSTRKSTFEWNLEWYLTFWGLSERILNIFIVFWVIPSKLGESEHSFVEVLTVKVFKVSVSEEDLIIGNFEINLGRSGLLVYEKAFAVIQDSEIRVSLILALCRTGIRCENIIVSLMMDQRDLFGIDDWAIIKLGYFRFPVHIELLRELIINFYQNLFLGAFIPQNWFGVCLLRG